MPTTEVIPPLVVPQGQFKLDRKTEGAQLIEASDRPFSSESEIRLSEVAGNISTSDHGHAMPRPQPQ